MRAAVSRNGVSGMGELHVENWLFKVTGGWTQMRTLDLESPARKLRRDRRDPPRDGLIASLPRFHDSLCAEAAAMHPEALAGIRLFCQPDSRHQPQREQRCRRAQRENRTHRDLVIASRQVEHDG